MRPIRFVHVLWFLCALLLCAWPVPIWGTEAPPADDVPEPPPAETPLAPGRVLPVEDPAPLPSPGLKYLLLASNCQAGTALPFLQLDTGRTLRHAVPGALLAASWLDDRRLALVRSQKDGAELAVLDAGTGALQAVDTLPSAPAAAWAQAASPPRCGQLPGSYRLWTGRERLLLSLRRSDTSFEVRSYRAADPLQPEARVELGRSSAFAKTHRLWQVVPALGSARSALLWKGPAGQVPALQVEVLEGERALGSVPSQDLAGCHFSDSDRLLCQVSEGYDRGWLFVIDIRPVGLKLRQLEHSGGAAAYALSADGQELAFVGSGGEQGPLVVLDLKSGLLRRSLLAGPGAGCGDPVWPQLFWLSGDRLLARGACSHALQVWSLDVPAAEAVAQPAPVPQPQEGVQEKPATRKAHRAQARRPAFWSPRF